MALRHRAGADDRAAGRAARPHPRVDGARLRLEDRRHRRTTRPRSRSCAQVPGVVGAAPAILGKALISTDRADAFISLKGIDPALEPTVTDIRARDAQRAASTALDAGVRRRICRASSLGQRSRRAARRATSATPCTLLTPQGTLSPMGMIPRDAPRARRRHLSASGCYEFDSAYGFVSLDFAERLLGKDDARSHPAAASTTSTRRRRSPSASSSELGADYVAQDWADMNQRSSRRCGSRRWRSRSPSASS